MEVLDKKTFEYIKISLEQGRLKEDIYKELLEQGLSIEVIQKNFDMVEFGKKKEDISKKTINIIVTIGVVLIGAGIFSFIAANWTVMTKFIKISIILISMISSYCAGWYLKEVFGFEKMGGAFILLGSIIYGAGIFLVAQMFNIRATWPDGFILWMIGIIAIAFSIRLYPLFYLAILLGSITIIGNPSRIFDSFSYNQFLLTSSLLLLVATVVTFAIGWMIRKEVPIELKEFY